MLHKSFLSLYTLNGVLHHIYHTFLLKVLHSDTCSFKKMYPVVLKGKFFKSIFPKKEKVLKKMKRQEDEILVAKVFSTDIR